MASYLSTKVIPSEFRIPLSCAHRNHRLVELPNGLTCLLVSDASTESASASMCVGSGSFKDPDSIPGLAHLCEHMLFMGTKDFPGAATYFELVMKFGGTCNAYTTGFRTVFQFEVPLKDGYSGNSTSFNEVLEIFASVFRNPLFDAKYITKEINNIDSEHQSNRTDLAKILLYGVKMMAGTDNPISKFSTGNLETLKSSLTKPKSQLSKLLKKYYEENFGLGNMRLVIAGPQSVNQLQKLAYQYFNGIERVSGPKAAPKRKSFSSFRMSDSHRSISTYSSDGASKTTECQGSKSSRNSLLSESGFHFEVGRVLLIKTGDFESKLRLVFPIEGSSQTLRIYQKLWCNILGDESTGSLFKHLEDSNMITSIFAYSSRLSKHTDTFILDFGLTKRARNNISSIVVATFCYIKMILDSSFEELQRYLNEFKTIDTLNYHFKEMNPSQMDEVGDLSEAMYDMDEIGVNNVFRGHEWSEITPSMVANFRDATSSVLSLRNFNIILVSSDDACLRSTCASSDILVDKYYGFEYVLNPIKNSWLHSIGDDVMEGNRSPSQTHIHLPAANQFLEYTFDEIQEAVKHVAKSSSDPDPSFAKYTVKDISSTVDPILLTLADNCSSINGSCDNYEIWYKHEPLLHSQTMITFNYSLGSSSFPPSARTTIGIELLFTILGSSINSLMYPSELLGYSWAMSPNLNGSNSISITVTGLTKGIQRVLGVILNQIEKIETLLRALNYKEFMKSRIGIRKKYETLITKGSSVELLLSGTQYLLEEKIWTIEERLEALEELDIQDLISIARGFLTDHERYTSVLVQGEISQPIALDISDQIINLFCNSSHYEEKKRNEKYAPSAALASYVIPSSRYNISMNASSATQTNTTCTYIQVGDRNSEFNRSFSKLLSILLQVLAPIELRIKRNLGYNIYVGQRINRSTIGIYITIISRQYTCEYLAEQIEDFLDTWLAEMRTRLYKSDGDIFFDNEILQPLLDNYSNPDSGGIGSPNINYGLDAAIKSGTQPSGPYHQQHRNLWCQIIDRTYRFSSVCGEEEYVLSPILDLSPSQFWEALQRTLSPNSEKRASLTIMLHSRNQLQNVVQEISYFLESKGLLGEFSEKELISIAKHPDPFNTLYQVFKERGDKYKFIRKPTKEVIGLRILARKKGTKHNSSGSEPRQALVTSEQFHHECVSRMKR